MVLRGWVGFGFGLLFCFVVGVFFGQGRLSVEEILNSIVVSIG